MPENLPVYPMVGGAIALIAVVTTLLFTFFTVVQRTVAIVQRLGKFMWEAGPGLNIKVPFIDTVAGRINLRVQQLDAMIEAQTVDKAIVRPEGLTGADEGE